MEIQHRQGRMHSNADSLSRRPCMDVECSYCDRVERKNSNSKEIGIQTDIKVCDSSGSLLEITLTDDASASPIRVRSHTIIWFYVAELFPYKKCRKCRGVIVL